MYNRIIKPFCYIRSYVSASRVSVCPAVASTTDKHWGTIETGPERGTGGTQRRNGERVGFGEGHSSLSPTWGQAMPPGKCLNFNMQICAF